MATVNEQFFDALVRHQVGLIRLSGELKRKVHRLLDSTEADIATRIRRGLAQSAGMNTPADVRRLQTTLKAVRATRLKAWEQITPEWIEDLREVARDEVQFLNVAVNSVVPVTINTILPSTQLLGSIVTHRPFEGRVMSEWASHLRRADINRIEGQIRIGLVQGESSPNIARRVVGTGRLRGRDGITELTRRQVETVTRTAVNSFTNQAKREFYEANSDLFSEEQFVATLDSVTTLICAGNDGKRFPVGQGPIPPLHWQCRSLRVAVLSGEFLGERPARDYTEQQILREYAQRNDLRSVTRRDRLPRGSRGGYDEFKRTRIRELTGRVPARVTYEQWLRRQSAVFQDDILGPSRGKLFRRGGLSLDRFTNRIGDELTLAQLAITDKKAFKAAGIIL